VEADLSGLPFILPEPPLSAANSAQPGWHEEVMFVSEKPGWGVTFKRPSFLADGKMVSTPPSDVEGVALIRAGTSMGVEVQVASGDDLAGGKDIAETVVTSLTEA
jgi:hypothetical protein